MISVYIHIPFCTQICTYCDFCKVFKNDIWIDQYLEALEKEINENYKNEKIKTLYIGGGTPSCLKIKQLKKLFNILNTFNVDKNAEITFECNIEDLTKEKLNFLKNKVNRLSIGVQTFNNTLLQQLNRKPVNIDNIKLAKKYFNNINIDLIYGLEGQTLNDFNDDLDLFLKLQIPHLSAYNLIIEPHTKFYIDNYKINNQDFEALILKKLKDYHYYEISNYAKKGFESRHNLTYWNNEHYYGFGLGACGYIKDERYENTRSLNKYINGSYRLFTHTLDLNETLQNEFILGFRKIDGINKSDFYQKYKIDIKSIKIINNLLKQNLLQENKDSVFINPKYIHLSNEILINFIETIY